jgi:hypothetical protein
MKCKYCESERVCKGVYPEGCFLKHQLDEIDYKSLLREFMIRTQHIPPTSEQEEIWWNEGTNAFKNPELLKKFIEPIL